MTQSASPQIVVARYYESPWPDDDLTWLEYVRERAHGGDGSPSTAIYNPYDYTDPSNQPKDMKDSPPFSQRYDEMGAEYGITYTPKLYTDPDDAIYKDWYKVRRQDFTTDPSDQSPAISADRKFASMEVEAASLNQIVDSDRHYKNDDKVVRAGQVDIRQVGNTQDSMLKGLFEFTWTSKSGTTESPRVVFQFLRPKGRLRPKSYLDYPVQMACTCKSFLYYGAQYYAVHGKYMYMPMFRPSLVPPVPQTMISRVRPGKGLNFKACKHVVAAYDWFEKQGLRILMHYRRYPEIGPPAKIMNVKEWERLMGFPFTLGEIQRRLSSRHPTLPKFFHTNFFRTKQQSAELNQWFQDTWLNRGEGEKIRVLETLVEHPEEIFYLLVKDAMEAPTKLSQAGIERAYDFMSRVVQPENDQEPEGKEYKRSGIPPIIPGAEPGQYGGPKLKEPKTTYKSVQPAIKDVEEAPAEEDMTPEEEKRLERFSPTKKKKKEKERPSWWRPPEPGKELPLKHVYQHKRRSKQAIDNVVAAYLFSLGA